MEKKSFQFLFKLNFTLNTLGSNGLNKIHWNAAAANLMKGTPGRGRMNNEADSIRLEAAPKKVQERETRGFSQE